MHWNEIDWELHGGTVQNRWNRLTTDDIEEIGGVRATLVEKIQERYSLAEDEAEQEVTTFEDALDPPSDPSGG